MLQAGSHEMTRDHTKLHEITRDCRDYAIVLQVELANAPARKLYEAAGYGARAHTHTHAPNKQVRHGICRRGRERAARDAGRRGAAAQVRPIDAAAHGQRRLTTACAVVGVFTALWGWSAHGQRVREK